MRADNISREDSIPPPRPGPDAAPHITEQPLLRAVLSFLLWSWVVLSGLVLSLVGLVLSVPFNPWVDPQRRMMERLNQLWGKGVLWVMPGIGIEVRGLEHLRAAGAGPFVICPNHQSVADIPLMLAVVSPVKTIAKASVFWLPPVGLQLRLAGHVPSGRGEAGGAERVLSRCQAWLRRGVSILVFPEGTRSCDGQVLRFGQGPFVLAARAGVPVLPVAIAGSDGVVAKGRFLFGFKGHIRVQILPPVPVEGEPKAVASRVRSLIVQALQPNDERI
ncbi:1-acyl-sn-glycerol-3-phosphate acyltransferase [Corallococcus sp. M34]|uniref:lysophospholipid acyltransferase family protein n=1 Tax=Citreicoccus inhibens TaxID=2849499 RepID=UPI001C231144|nr:lysophospholipid acyltransferase family protein [Citreicoccus inhibens]MBU8895226.1 1-acyl-sn-glycerol-3-phosphate acyltransferase [Citreicoccus inhibens]